MINIYSPKDEVELLFIKSLLDGEQIPYYVHNEHYGALNIGPQIELLNTRTIQVSEEFADRARELIKDFLNVEASERPRKVTALDKFRMIFEGFMFAWFVPGRRRKKEEFKND